MNPATTLRKITPSLYNWASLHPKWKIDFDSYALKTTAGVVYVDPLITSPAVIGQLKALGEPLAIVLTNAHHDRDADWFRKQFEIQIYAHEMAPHDCDTKIDVLVMDGEHLPGGIKAIHLPGSTTSELALYKQTGGGVVLIGDALLNLPDAGLALLPDQYIEDRKLCLRSLTQLLDLNFKTVTFAHGDPIVGDAKNRIAAFLKKPSKKTI